jgi:hypothetical protein
VGHVVGAEGGADRSPARNRRNPSARGIGRQDSNHDRQYQNHRSQQRQQAPHHHKIGSGGIERPHAEEDLDKGGVGEEGEARNGAGKVERSQRLQPFEILLTPHQSCHCRDELDQWGETD